MYNYAYQIGNVIKIGMDLNDVSANKRKGEYQQIADIGAYAFGFDRIQITELWRRRALNHQETHRIKRLLEGKFEDSALPGGGEGWLKADPNVVNYFKGLSNSEDNGNLHMTNALKQLYGDLARI